MVKRLRYSLLEALAWAALMTLGFLIWPTDPVTLRNISLRFGVFFGIWFIVSMIAGPWYLRLLRIRSERERTEQQLVERPFRCFRCEAPITPDEERCPNCGWTWKL